MPSPPVSSLLKSSRRPRRLLKGPSDSKVLIHYEPDPLEDKLSPAVGFSI